MPIDYLNALGERILLSPLGLKKNSEPYKESIDYARQPLIDHLLPKKRIKSDAIKVVVPLIVNQEIIFAEDNS